MIGGFRSILCVSVFQGSLLVIVVMIDGSQNAIAKVAFERSKYIRGKSRANKVHKENGITRRLKTITRFLTVRRLLYTNM